MRELLEGEDYSLQSLRTLKNCWVEVSEGVRPKRKVGISGMLSFWRMWWTLLEGPVPVPLAQMVISVIS